jgi:Iron-containing redox enzyme
LSTNPSIENEILHVAQLCDILLTKEDDSILRRRLARRHVDSLLSTNVASGAPSSPDAISNLTAFVNSTLERPRYIPSPDDLDDATSHWLLLQYAPMALTPGCLLQECTNAANSHERSAALLHSVHRSLIGAQVASSQPRQPYRCLLESLGIELPPLASSMFYRNTNICAASWSLLAWRASLSMLWAERTPEILGAAMFEVSTMPPALVQTALSRTPLSPCLEHNKQVFETLLEAIRLLETRGTDVREFQTRLVHGYVASNRIFVRWHSEMILMLRDGCLSPRQSMIRLVEAKGRFAVGYHDRLKINERPFDEIVVSDPAAFVDGLSQSRWIVPGRPDESLLVSQLIGFGGPMFRIFQPGEIDVIRRWISSVNGDPVAVRHALVDRAHQASTTNADEQSAPSTCDQFGAGRGRKPPSHLKIRDLYYRLLDAKDQEHTEQQALHFALDWLAITRRRMKDSDVARHGPNLSYYEPDKLRAWFEQAATEQQRSYVKEPRSVPLRSRQNVVTDAVQLCPMIFIDGCWLQRHADAALVESRIGRILYQIFSDEVGNGDPSLNHPNIYRDLMAEMSVELPTFPSRDFCDSPLFSDEAFLVPTFWLSLARFPRRLLPETLGLNLAMELSGVGGAYRAARDELHEHGFSTRFVDLHNTIDNVSSGHSAMAIDAIDLYMAQHPIGCTEDQLAQQWMRIRTGYNALSPPRRRLYDKWSPPRYVA